MFTTDKYPVPSVSISDPVTGLALNISLAQQGFTKDTIETGVYNRIVEMRKAQGLPRIDDFGETK